MGISFHAVVVLGLGKNLIFKSILGRCDIPSQFFNKVAFVEFQCVHCGSMGFEFTSGGKSFFYVLKKHRKKFRT